MRTVLHSPSLVVESVGQMFRLRVGNVRVLRARMRMSIGFLGF